MDAGSTPPLRVRLGGRRSARDLLSARCLRPNPGSLEGRARQGVQLQPSALGEPGEVVLGEIVLGEATWDDLRDKPDADQLPPRG